MAIDTEPIQQGDSMKQGLNMLGDRHIDVHVERVTIPKRLWIGIPNHTMRMLRSDAVHAGKSYTIFNSI